MAEMAMFVSGVSLVSTIAFMIGLPRILLHQSQRVLSHLLTLVIILSIVMAITNHTKYLEILSYGGLILEVLILVSFKKMAISTYQKGLYVMMLIGTVVYVFLFLLSKVL